MAVEMVDGHFVQHHNLEEEAPEYVFGLEGPYDTLKRKIGAALGNPSEGNTVSIDDVCEMNITRDEANELYALSQYFSQRKRSSNYSTADKIGEGSFLSLNWEIFGQYDFFFAEGEFFWKLKDTRRELL